MNVFTYGSLMFPEVWRRVTGGTVPGHPARLAGYEARALRGVTYPVLVAIMPESVTEGVVYRGVDAAALARLDLFEGNFYVRREVTVGTEEGKVTAQVYAAAWEDHPDILPERWRAGEFAARHLAGFLRADPGFAGPR
ncbi:MAG: gamma-glutamylcyclotransferase family protein [Verrucomicrobiota bacterium]